MYHLQIWFIGRTLASQAGKAGSIPVICLFENSLKTWESQYLSAFPQFLLFPSRKHFFPVVTGELVWCKEPQNNEFRTKNFLNQDFLYGISLFCLCSENRDFLHSKISCFCIFFAEIGVLNTNRTPGGPSAASGVLHFIKTVINALFIKKELYKRSFFINSAKKTFL